MGIFDQILGNATSSATDNAAMWSNIALAQGQGEANRALKQGTKQANQALTTNATQGLGALDKGYDSAIAALGSAGTQAQQLLKQGVDSGVATTLSGNQAYSPYIASGGGANTMLANAYGLNGQAGHDAATSAFQTSPGYAFQRDQGADAAARKAASLGLAGSGSTLSAILDQSSRLANTEYGNWLTGLQGLGTQGLAAASDVSSNNRTAGGLQAAGGQYGAQLAQNTGQNIGQAYIGQGTGKADLYGNLGRGLSSNFMNLGQGLSANDMNTAQGFASVDMAQGKADDNATSANNSILSKLIGQVAGLPLGGTSLSGATGGFSITPGSGGSFTFSPAASGSASGGGIFGPSLSSVGTGVKNFFQL